MLMGTAHCGAGPAGRNQKPWRANIAFKSSGFAFVPTFDSLGNLAPCRVITVLHRNEDRGNISSLDYQILARKSSRLVEVDQQEPSRKL